MNDRSSPFASESSGETDARSIVDHDPSEADAISLFAPEGHESEAVALPSNRSTRPIVAGRTRRVAIGVAFLALLCIAGFAGYEYSRPPVSLNQRIAEVQRPDTPPALADNATAADVQHDVAETAPTRKTAVEPIRPRSPIDAERPQQSARRPNVTAGAAATPAPRTPLTGDWAMSTRVATSELKRYEGLRIGYAVELQQQGDRITGRGVKIRENGRRIGRTAQTPIEFQGVLHGDRAELTFTEHGRRRPSAGRLVLARVSPNVLRGRFSSDAAGSSGDVEIRRD
jgi:hypothetical protein